MKTLFRRRQLLPEALIEHGDHLKPEKSLDSRQHHPAFVENVPDGLGQLQRFGSIRLMICLLICLLIWLIGHPIAYQPITIGTAFGSITLAVIPPLITSAYHRGCRGAPPRSCNNRPSS